VIGKIFSLKNPKRDLIRSVVLMNFLQKGEIREYPLSFGEINFLVKDYPIGWDFVQARDLIERFDGEVDAIVITGAREYAAFGSVESPFSKVRDLIRIAQKTPVYTGSDLQALFANWTIRRAERNDPGIFRNKKILFHFACFTPCAAALCEQSKRVVAADSLMIKVPILLDGFSAIENFMRLASPLISKNLYYRVDFLRTVLSPKLTAKLQEWVAQCDVFVTYASLMKSIEDFSVFRGKIVFIDSASEALRDKFIEGGVAEIIEFMPDLSEYADKPITSFALLNALMDQARQASHSESSLEAYTLELLDKTNIKPRPALVMAPPVRRCAFVIHPLSVGQMLNGTGLGRLSSAPKFLRNQVESAMAHLPVFPFGHVLGAKSEHNGQEVVCELFAITATPGALMRMNEERLYSQLVKAAETAKANGALMIGLGAYTKVAGDAGVTVARRSSIPVTTGNSYSAAATLWAARVMVEKMQGFSPDLDNPAMHRESKAMVIGATGSIGRVSSLLLAESFKELVLIATRPEKLLELREEIMDSYPNVAVKIATDPDGELPTTDLIVTATSSRGKRIMDIMMVKPGAVICDCSRPLDISPEDAALRPDVMIIESGEIDLPGAVDITRNIGLPKPSVYACLAETVLLTMEGRYENFSLSRHLSLENVKEIYRIGRKHGAKLSAIHGYNGVVTEEMIAKCKMLAAEKLKSWPFLSAEAKS
jgi:predicted amino acid dehydrogenase